MQLLEIFGPLFIPISGHTDSDAAEHFQNVFLYVSLSLIYVRLFQAQCIILRQIKCEKTAI